MVNVRSQMTHKNIYGDDVPDGLCTAPLDAEAWESCEHCHVDPETGLISCDLDGNCDQSFDDDMEAYCP